MFAPTLPPPADHRPSTATGSATPSSGARDEDGSLVTEYGLLAVVAATIAGVVISWASNGALVTLFNALLRHARGLVGA
jgi:Flp pilus assembly pilin Flp